MGNAMIVYYQAALRYTWKMDNDVRATPALPTAEHQGEGAAFWRVISPVLHSMEPAIADYVTSFYTMTTTPTVPFHFCPTKKMLTENLPSGMTVATDMGTLEGTDGTTVETGTCTLPPPPPSMPPPPPSLPLSALASYVCLHASCDAASA